MSEQFLGQIRMFGGPFAPKEHAFCNGQLQEVTQNTALFSLLGTMYGGDGRTTFALPDLQGRLPVHFGQGNGLSRWPLGQQQGSAAVTLMPDELPPHTHAMQAMTASASASDPSGNVLANANSDHVYRTAPASAPKPLASGALGTTGGGAAHDNLMPALGISFIIALVGVYPSRN